MPCYRRASILCYICAHLVIGQKNIWNIGTYVGKLPEVNLSDVTPKSFYQTLSHRAFVVRGFHDTLDQVAGMETNRTMRGNDSIAWLESLLRTNPDEIVDTIEGELRETRLAPVIHRAKWKYFLEKYKDVDMYAVTRAPLALRKYLKLMPIFSCGGQASYLQPPNVWVSGGIAASKSVVHADGHYNQHCVLKGSKKFLLIPSFINIETDEFGWVVVESRDGSPDFVTPPGFEDAYGEYIARIDTDDVDEESFPGWKDVPWFDAELFEGDCIYMPINWYHYVESRPEITVTWHNWFERPRSWNETDVCFGEAHNNGRPVDTSQCVYEDDVRDPKSKLTNWKSLNGTTSLCDI